jgi:hypothetical protein
VRLSVWERLGDAVWRLAVRWQVRRMRRWLRRNVDVGAGDDPSDNGPGGDRP